MVVSKKFYTERNTLQFVFGESCKLNRPMESLFDLGHTCFLIFSVFFLASLHLCSLCLSLSLAPLYLASIHDTLEMHRNDTGTHKHIRTDATIEKNQMTPNLHLLWL